MIARAARSVPGSRQRRRSDARKSVELGRQSRAWKNGLVRTADDIICHCRSEEAARTLWQRVTDRLSDCGLEVHPQKAKVVYLKDTNRKVDYPAAAFDLLSYRFQFLFTWRTAERMVPGERGYQPPGAFCPEIRSRVRRSSGKNGTGASTAPKAAV